ncbi:MAG TPA: SPOR domain-containing protein [Ramlibacter sp.]|jgi:DedD protein|nr:SPOR domain-containing protein [Ramlibacter sp.]
MALFKLRKKKVDEPVAAASPAESIEVMRRRARHRLIGAVVLVLAAVIGFPVLFDTQPRPVAVDIPIEIPDRNKVKPLAAPPAPAPAAPVAAGKVTPNPAPAPTPPVASAKPEPAAPAAEKVPAPAPATQSVAKSEPAPEKKPEPKAASGAADAAKARALLEGKSIDLADAGARYVVQVGAFAEKDKALQAQRKLDRAGLRNYTQVADTEEGKRIRVRAGPFASRTEADEAAEKIKGLDLPVRILTL